MSKPGLAALFGPHSVSDFMEQNWPDVPFLIHDLAESVAPLTSLHFLRSLDTLLNSWSGMVQVHLPDIADEASSVDATPHEAKRMFDEKMALLFNNVQKNSSLLQEWLTAIHQDLGLPAMTYSRCMVYATPDG